MAYQTQLLADAVALLAAAWGTEQLVPPSQSAGCMALVRIPVDGSAATSKAVQDTLHFEHKVECPVKTVNGRLYVRVSAAVYNEIEDYQKLATAVTAIAAEIDDAAASSL
jgi:isopenicillin-N epimerase